MSENRIDYLIDVDELLGPQLKKKLPRFARNFLKKRIHQEDINDCILKAEHYKGVGFFDEALDYIGITYRVRGLENLDMSKKYVFACNHPLGGPESLIIGSIFRKIYGAGFKVPSNELIYSMKPLQEFFVPVNIFGKQSRDINERISDMFRSDSQVVVFPSGMCARKIGSKLTEMPWKKMFITQARKFERDVVPVHISGHNSKWYFFLTKLSKFLKLKFNLGMIFLVDELFNQAGKEFVITFGEPVQYTVFDRSKSDMQWADEIKDRVELLSRDNGCTPNM